MNKELFGVFGGRDAFSRFRSELAFDTVVGGDAATVGIRDPGSGIPGRSTWYSGEEGTCVIWGEAFAAADNVTDTARWLLERFAEDGRDALGDLNGSYVAYVDHDGTALVATDPLRSWEVFYADVGGLRVFSTDVGAIKRVLDDPTVQRESLLEYLHLGTVLGERTLFERVRRAPFDGYLTGHDVGSFDRFVYEPREYDYADELASRLGRAIGRRAHYPGSKGLLLSAGMDSRLLLSRVPNVEHTYTVGNPGAQEVDVARKLAHQYGASHEVLEPGGRYLQPTDGKVRYGQSIKESLHIHHAGYTDRMDATTMYHGLLFDTLLKGYFLERDSLELFGAKLPLRRLDQDVDPVESLLDTLGYLPAGSERTAAATAGLFSDVDLADPGEFLRERLEIEYEKARERADSVHNAMDLLVIMNQPVLPFHTHLADNFLESFVALDAELLDWHLTTPPAYRSDATYRRAIRRLDEDLLQHRPPDQPHSVARLNQIERFARRKLPWLEPFEPAWPDREAVYDANDMDDELFPVHRGVRDLPVRLKLRVNDARWWLE
ncbi:hypothetical protein ACFQH6_16000 [Halobacteriaceae archaeon GCM10025711]